MPLQLSLVARLALFLPVPLLPTTVAAQATSETRLVLAPAGNEARYRVREQLASIEFPNDAVGATNAISGEIVLDAEGRVVAPQSVITVDLRGLKSDKERRDGYIQRRTLETDEYPHAVLRVTALQGLPAPLPTTGALSFTLLGDLTIHGTTRPTTWQVAATATGTGYSGTARTTFTFDEFGLTKPRVAVVLTVEDEIALEYDFHFVRR